jgi:[protein-PII] uridylyltransferase
MQLMTGGTEFMRAGERQRELLMQETARLAPTHLGAEEIAAHFAALPARYFQVHSAREILDDLVLAHRFMRLQFADEEDPLAPVVNWHNDPDRACVAVKVCTWDRAGLFSKIAGSLSAASLNILSAQIFTRADAIVLDTFYVTDARTGGLGDASQRDRFEQVLYQALTGQEVDIAALIRRQKITRPLFQAYTGEHLPTRIQIDNEASESRTLIEIETEDRLGLLYKISQAISDLELDISAARICTEKGAAIDTFYVSETDGQKVERPERLNAIERKLRHAIHSLETAA